MPIVVLSGSIRQRAGGVGSVEVGGETVRAAIAALEAAHPALRGWVVDEQGVLRRHVKLYLHGVAVPLDASIGRQAELHVVAAISGG